MLKAFIRDINPIDIISYCDISYFTGAVYTSNKFTYSHRSSPNYKYFKINNTTTLYSRQKFQKHKLSKCLPLFDKTKSGHDNMINNGYDRIWDCGNDVYHLQCV
jgi:hypothetical protein